jgi:hypothetical protein
MINPFRSINDRADDAIVWFFGGCILYGVIAYVAITKQAEAFYDWCADYVVYERHGSVKMFAAFLTQVGAYGATAYGTALLLHGWVLAAVIMMITALFGPIMLLMGRGLIHGGEVLHS